MHYVPVVTSMAGACLTKANWQDTGCTVFSYHLDALLIKPGYEVLSQIDNLVPYVACPGELVLNASMLRLNKLGLFRLISPINGNKLDLDYPALLALIYSLKPHAVLLPANCLSDSPELLHSWPKEIKRYCSHRDLLTHSKIEDCGIYFTADAALTQDIEHFKSQGYSDFYVQGDIVFDKLNYLKSLGITYLETDSPAKDAFAAKAYQSERTIELQDMKHEFSFNVLADTCGCPTCRSQLTQAYLHHLYAHTPLLAQRMLIQHNIYYYSAYFARDTFTLS
jgi:queuine tRNA-ribosyltransferase